MPGSIELRQSLRYTIVLPVLYDVESSTESRSGVGWTSNLSEGGACLELAERLDPATPLTLALRTPEGEIELKAKVAWTREADGTDSGHFHGVTFTEVPPDHQRAVRELLRTKGQGRTEGVRIPVKHTVLCRRKGNSAAPIQGRTGDISRAGLLLFLPRALPVGTLLDVTMQTSRGPLTAEGSIVWVGPPGTQTPGETVRHGFRFSGMNWSSQLALGHLLAGKL